ncbi:MAG: tetratricopeptide repeat protein [Salinivirgaceae bacterium]|nr:tetratricopeptide repeat protein [Salinivirgaceae bacterium]
MLKSIKLLFVLLFASLYMCGNDTLKSNFEDSILNVIIYENNYENKISSYIKLISYLENNDLNKSFKYIEIASNLAKNNNKRKDEILVLIEKTRCNILQGNFNTASEILFEIEQLLKNTNDENLWGRFFYIKAYAFSFTGEFVNSMDNALKSVPKFINTKDSVSLANTYNLIGVIYDITGNSQKALENYLMSLDLAEKLNDYSILGNLSNNIGIIYDLLKNNDNALMYYYKALEYYNKIADLKGVANSFNNIASILIELKRYDEAILYVRKAMSLNKQISDITSDPLLYQTLGYIYTIKQNYDSAYYYYDLGLQQNIKLNDLYGLAYSYSSFGSFYTETNNSNKAIQNLKIAISYAKKANVSGLLEDLYINLSKVYAAKNNYKLAYENQLYVKAISDSLREASKKEELKLSELQIEFRNQTNKHEKEIKKLKTVRSEDLKKQIIEKLFFILFIIVIFFIAAILYISLKRQHKFNKKLMLQNREIEDQKELIEISNLELKEQYTFTETLLNTIPNAVFYTNKNSHILGCNNAFEEISGKKVDDLIGINLSEINIKTNLSCNTTKLFGNPGKGLIRNEGSMIFSNNLEHYVICYRKGIVDSNDKLLGILGIIIDITEIRKTEKDLKYSQSKLKEAIAAKDKFFSIMAHDLKNPFNAILGLSNLMSDDYDNHTQEEIKQYITLIHQSSTHIYNLLENLLEWARTQSGSIDKFPILFPVNEIIQECVNLFHQSIKQKSIILNFNAKTEYLIFADKNMIMTVIRNLLSNAIKYSEVNSNIDINIEKNTNELDISITDYGMGIESNNIAKLFKIDKMVSTPGALKEKGTGLGLIICNEFVKINNGKLKVKSKLNYGTTFTVTLPTTIN